MTAIAPWFAGFLAGLIVGALAGGFFVWVAHRARWLEREADIEQERGHAARRQWWRGESIRRGVLYDSVMESRADPLTPAGEVKAERFRRWRETELALRAVVEAAPLKIARGKA